jgi:phosphoglycolate phosphatase
MGKVYGIRGLVFDLDGTLCNTLGDIAYAANRALEAIGVASRPVEAYAEWVGWGLKRLCAAALGEDSGERLERLYEVAVTEYNKFPMERTTIYPGVAELLDELTRRNILLGVVSNKPHAFAVKIMETMFARWKFVRVEGYIEESRRKPDPKAVLDIAAEMKMLPSEVALVGDSAVDIETARNAGMIAVGVTWGFRGPAELAQADRIIQHPGELLEVIV